MSRTATKPRTSAPSSRTTAPASKPHTGRVAHAKPRANINSNDVTFAPEYTVTSTTDSGGRVLKNIEVICCFWGTYWTTSPSPSPSTGDYATAINAILTSSYMSRLYQYRGIGNGSLVYCDFNDSSDPADGYTDDDVVNMLKDRLQNTPMPMPAAGVDRFYAVIVPPGIHNALTQDAGQHQSFDYNGAKGYYAWISNNGLLTGHNCVTKVFSHELVEACTDPDVDNNNGNGILVNGTQAGGTAVVNDEIGDTCNDQYATVNMNGIMCTVQSYWSKADNACVLPVPPAKGGSLDIVAIRKAFSSDQGVDYITELKAQDAGGLTYWLSRADVINLMYGNANTFFVNGDDGSRAQVIAHGHYIETVADNSTRDNLLSLPTF